METHLKNEVTEGLLERVHSLHHREGGPSRPDHMLPCASHFRSPQEGDGLSEYVRAKLELDGEVGGRAMVHNRGFAASTQECTVHQEEVDGALPCGGDAGARGWRRCRC
jgi:hypothetical protein